MKWLDSFKRQGGASLNDSDLAADNESTNYRNTIVVGGIIVAVLLLWGLFYAVTRPTAVTYNQAPPPEFGSVVTPDFGLKNTQSALQLQQLEMESLKDSLNSANKNNQSLESKLDSALAKMTELVKRGQEQSENRLSNILSEINISMEDKISGLEQQAAQMRASASKNTNPFGSLPFDGQVPTQPTNKNDMTGEMNQPALIAPMGIQTFSYQYADTAVIAPYKRTSENYVPTGSFVTAVLTGAADANAGVNAQGDTAPITFRTIHDGILPNGKRSRLKGCFVTASVYGEISSNRGVARLNNLSCIFNDKERGEEILDIPVQGTAFNFGRNGIRGTPIMRNGKIIQMAGISGLFTGLGDTAKNASSTQISGPGGVVSSVNPSQALMNMGGSALESVGSQMAEYYIKLAEQYHPIIELNPGAIVNLVFLKGFPLDANKLAEYEAKLYGESAQASATQTLMSTYLNPLGAIGGVVGNAMGGTGQQGGQPNTAPPMDVVNPMLNQLPPALRSQAVDMYNAQKQANPF